MQEVVLEFLIALDYSVLLILFFVALVAGFIDSIAGGGGMITIPALLLSGTSPLEALATNKLQASFGSFSATLHFYKKGYIQFSSSWHFALLVFVFSALGSIAVQFIKVDLLSKILPFLILLFGIYFLCAPNLGETHKDSPKYKGFLWIALLIVGFYDGFFGPGTGSFFMLALILLGGFGITRSLGEAKLYNFSTNLASLLFFALGGQILWGVGLVMAIGQFLGANLGSRMAIRYGIRIIKPLIVIVSFAMSLKLLYQAFVA